jgi:oligopeptide/dipeptide ABC transporter ATP-binding protein
MSPVLNPRTRPLLEVLHVTKEFRTGFLGRHSTAALTDLTLTIDGNVPSITAVVGESGSGKTTLGRLLLGLTAPTTGEVRYHGTDLRRLSGPQRRQFRREVQAIFQDPYEVFNPFYKVDHVLTVPIAKFGLARSTKDARALIEEALRVVGLNPDETLGRYPHQLSGGQRQRVMVARALLLRPKLIVADEPVSMVDASLRASILEALGRLKQDFGVSFLYITHDLATAYQISENVMVLYQGAVAEAGDVELVVKTPQHPYTQLLLESIPVADPDRPWQPLPIATETPAVINVGCKFADRCPYVLPDHCRVVQPPLFRTNSRRVVACYLQMGAAHEGDLADVFAGSTSAEETTSSLTGS